MIVIKKQLMFSPRYSPILDRWTDWKAVGIARFNMHLKMHFDQQKKLKWDFDTKAEKLEAIEKLI